MNLATVFFILIIAAGFIYLIYRYVPDPFRKALLAVAGLALVVWLLQILGFFEWLSSKNV